MVREPEDYFYPEESGDLSRYAEEAENEASHPASLRSPMRTNSLTWT